jgi:transposase InsO family protein
MAARCQYRTEIAGIGALASMSSMGDLFDNAPMESFFKTLKAELVDDAAYATRAAARSDVFAFLDAKYNRQRIHSAIGEATSEQVRLTAACSPNSVSTQAGEVHWRPTGTSPT